LGLSDRELNEIAEISERINTVPADHLLVEVGRSPAVFFEYIRNAYPNRKTTKLPTSGLRHFYKGKITRPLNQEELEAYAKYFGEQIGKQVKDSKAIVLVDYSVSGISLTNNAKILDTYLKSQNLNIPVKIIHIKTSNEVHIDWSGHEHSKVYVNSKKSGLSRMLYLQKLKTLSTLKSFDFEKWKSGEMNASDFFHSTEQNLALKELVKGYLIKNKDKPVTDIEPLKFKRPLFNRIIEKCALLFKKYTQALP